MSKSKSSSKDTFCFDQKMVDAISAPVCIQDANGDFLGANRAFRTFFGFRHLDSREITDLYALLGGGAGQKNREVDSVILHAGGRETFEATVQRSGESERFVIFHKAAITDDDNEIVGLVTTLLDRTEQRKTEQQLRHAQKMEAIGTLAGGIAHDFNNVLTPIIGYSEIMRLMAQRQENFDTNSAQFVGEILAAAKRAKSLVEQILTFSRSREQKETPQYLHPIVKEVIKLLRATLPATIEVREDVDPECGMVSIDPVQLHQVLLNLCTNSAQAIGDEQGKITARLAMSSPDIHGSDWVELSVADSGPGISLDLQERVFEPYFTTKEKGQGTGLGLAMVHGIVTQCGGRIELESERGNGTVFHLYFPCVVPVGDGTILEDGPVTSLGGTERVLVVDDQAAVLEVTKKILETLGYEVTTCLSPRKALTLFASNPYAFDLVLTDLTMPDMTGVELCVELKKLRATIPVILCSGYEAKFSEEELEAAGLSAWFTKPVTLQKLASMVRSTLDTV